MTNHSEVLPESVADRPAARWQGRVSPRLTMIAAAVLVVLMVVAAGITVWNLHQQADRETRANLGKLALVIAEQTSRSFQSVDLVLDEVANRIAADGLTTPDALRERMESRAAHNFLKERAHHLLQIGNLIVVGDDGRLISHSQSWPVVAMSIAEREQFRHLRDSNDESLFVSEPVRNRVDGSWTLYLARRLNGPEGAFLGIVQAAVRLHHFEEFYRSVAMGEGGSISLWRRDGIMLARHPMIEGMIGRTIDTQSIVRSVQDQADRGGFLVQGLVEGRAGYVALGTVRGFPLVIVTALTEAVVLAPWRRDAIRLLLGASGAVAGVLVLLLMLSRQIRAMRRSEADLARQNLELESGRRRLLDAQRIGKLGHWEVNAAGTTALWSPQLFEISGLPPAPHVPFETMLALIHPDDVETFLRKRQHAREMGETLIHEFRWVRPDGQIRWVRMEAGPLAGQRGQAGGCLG